MKKPGSFLIVIIGVFFLSKNGFGQSEYLYRHDLQVIPVNVDFYSGTNSGYKVDLIHFRLPFSNIGLFTRFSNQDYLYNCDENNSSYSKLGYFLPFGFNIPIKQSKNFRLSINTNYYWTINPRIFELDVRAEKKYFSAFAAYRFSSFEEVKGVYLGVSLGFHHFSNNRKLSKIQESGINQALCNSNIDECTIVDISENGYLLVHANLRKNIAYNSTFFFIENGCLNFNSIDSICMNRSIEILNTLYDNNCLKDLAGIEVHLYYGGFITDTKYDNGSNATIRSSIYYEDAYTPYYNNSTTGFSKTTLTNGPFNLYTAKIKKADFKEVIKPEGLLIESKINEYLTLWEKVNPSQFK